MAWVPEYESDKSKLPTQGYASDPARAMGLFHDCWRLLLQVFFANTENTYYVVYGHQSQHQTGVAWRPASKKFGKNILALRYRTTGRCVWLQFLMGQDSTARRQPWTPGLEHNPAGEMSRGPPRNPAFGWSAWGPSPNEVRQPGN